MNAVTPSPNDVQDEAPAERNSVLLIVLGVLGVLSAVIAGLVIFSSGGSPAARPEPAVPVQAGEQSVTLGKDSAGTKVVVYEDFADPRSRELEIATRDFLRIEAARGRVRVDYRPFAADDTLYSQASMAAWLAVLSSGTPRQALTFHDVLFDRQPERGSTERPQFSSWAKGAGIDDATVTQALGSPDTGPVQQADRVVAQSGVRRAPVVLVDGTPLTAASPTALADKLQRLVLSRD